MVTSHLARAGLAGLALSTLLAACSSDPTEKRAASADVTSEVDAAYDGPDAPYFTEVPAPDKVGGQPFDVGFLQISGAQPVLVAMQEAAQEEVEALGGTMIVKDAGLDVQKQQSQIDELITQDVDVILGYPVVASALDAAVTRAKDAGIPFVALNTPADVTQPVLNDAVTNVNQALDYAVWSTMKALADAHEGGSFAVMGFAAPVDTLTYMTERQIHWGQELGLRYLGRVDAQADSPAGYGPAADAILTKYDDADIVVTYNDQSALAAQAAAVAGGRTDIAFADPNSGQAIAKSAIEAGKLELVFRAPWEAIGRTAVHVAYTVITDADARFETVINVPGTLVTKDDVNDVPWIE